MKSDEQLKRDDPELYKVAREGKTERPFSGQLVNEKTPGMYHCAVCGVTLFSSSTKFDSGTGWPSFTDPAVKEVITLHEDNSHGTRRTEVRCANCGAHLGHVFPDGPKDGDRVCDRYCINSVSLELRADK